MVTVHNFTYGVFNPALGYVMSCLGSFLGLRCVTRARAHEGRAKATWLGLAAVAIGACGVWVMHFIAMLGFTIPGQSITYNVPVTIASMLIAIAVVGAGLFIVGYGDGSLGRLAVGGLIVGVGVASMHYLGMAAMIMPDTMSYNPVLLALSLVIAVVAGTVALWIGTWVRGIGATVGASLVMGVAVSGMHYTGMAAMIMPDSMSYNPVLLALSLVIAVVAGTVALWIGTWVRGIGATVGASLVMGVAVSGMHYTGMAAMHVSRGAMAAMSGGGASPVAFLFPLLVGISVLTLVMTLTITMSPNEQEIREDLAMRERMEQLQQRAASGEQRPRQRSGGIHW